MIMAKGTAQKPITFTAEDTFDPTADNSMLPKAGLWGGLIILGKAPITDPIAARLFPRQNKQRRRYHW